MTGVRRLEPWEFALILGITGEPKLELAVLIRAAGSDSPPPSQSNWMPSLLTRLEQLVSVPARPLDTAAAQAVVDSLVTMTVDALPPAGSAPSDDDIDRVRAARLDVIIAIGGADPGGFAGAATYGAWTISPDVADHGAGAPAGFWEVFDGADVSVVALDAIAPDATRRRLAAAVSHTQHCFVRNRRLLAYTAVSLIVRELRRLTVRQRLEPDVRAPVPDVRLETPSPAVLRRYVGRQGIRALQMKSRALCERMRIGRRQWRLYTGRGRFDPANLSDLVESVPPDDEFWADPFFLPARIDGRTYVAFEVYEYRKRKGKISVGEVIDGRVVYLGDAIDTSCHLSYPHVFEYEGNIYMVPEASRNRRVELWRCIEFPMKWELHRTALEGMSVADVTLFQDDGHWWMFANTSDGIYGYHNTELSIFRIDSPLMREIVPHELNPVLLDSRSARNAGRVRRQDGRLVRVAQNNGRVYGFGFSLMEITRLSLSEYEERPIVKMEPRRLRDVLATHHIDFQGDNFILDGMKRQ